MFRETDLGGSKTTAPENSENPGDVSAETSSITLGEMMRDPSSAKALQEAMVQYLQIHPDAKEVVITMAERIRKTRELETDYLRKPAQKPQKSENLPEGEKLSPEDLEVAIGEVMNFDNLYSLIRRQGGITSTDGKHFIPDEKLIGQAELYRKLKAITPQALKKLTRACGFRDRVVYLHDIEIGFALK
ncbi:MAG: hypothetical protein WC250_01280 [Candidatus Paceibacterota bacterium]|jgi:hypothetical protein